MAFKKGRTPWNKGLMGSTPWNKGKPWSEEIKRKISLTNKGREPWNKGKTDVYSEETLTKFRMRKHSEETKQKLSILKKGKPNYKMRGFKHSEETRKQMSSSAKIKIFTEEHKKNMSKGSMGQTPWNKGIQLPDEMKQKIKSSCKGINVGRKHSEESKLKMSVSSIGRIVSEETKKKLRGRKLSEETKQGMRIRHIKRVEEQFNKGLPIHPMIGNNETEILDQIEIEFNIELERQFRVAGYFIDGYDIKNNIIYEVDEGYHFKDGQIVKDEVREQNIVNELNCEVIRIKDY